MSIKYLICLTVIAILFGFGLSAYKISNAPVTMTRFDDGPFQVNDKVVLAINIENGKLKYTATLWMIETVKEGSVICITETRDVGFSSSGEVKFVREELKSSMVKRVVQWKSNEPEPEARR